MTPETLRTQISLIYKVPCTLTLFSTQLPHYVVSPNVLPKTMSQNPMSLLESFNPFITHSFTNGSGLAPHSALPPSHAPLPSAHVRTYHAELYPLSDSSSVASTDSSPSSRNSTPMHSPKPRVASMVPPPSRQIFERFRKDATTPELALKKRPPVQSYLISRSK